MVAASALCGGAGAAAAVAARLAAALPCEWDLSLGREQREKCGFVCENPWGLEDPHYCGDWPPPCCCAPAACDLPAAAARAFVGVNWNDHYSKRPLPRKVQFQILKENGIRHIKTFTPEGLAEIAEVYGDDDGGGGEAATAGAPPPAVRVYVGIPNRELVPLAASDGRYARSYVGSRLKKYASLIALVVVGNEPLICIRTADWVRNRECGSLNAPARLLPALRNVRRALIYHGMAEVPVSTALNGGIMEMTKNPWTPCIADYRAAVKPLLQELWAFLREARAPFIVNVYSWFAALQGSISPRIACGAFDPSDAAAAAAVPSDGRYNYYFNFDMQIDMQRVAMCKNNVTDLDLWIGETGWPSAGDARATPTNAMWFFKNAIHRAHGETLVNATHDTFRFRGIPFPVFLFEAFDEKRKYEIEHGNRFENSFGLFYENGVPKWSDANGKLLFNFTRNATQPAEEGASDKS